MAKIIDPYSKKELNDDNLRVMIRNLVLEESKKTIITGRDSQGNPQFAEEYQNKINLARNYISHLIASNISANVLNNIIDNTISVTSSLTFDKMKKGQNIITNPRIFGQQFGIFLEKALFGFVPNEKPFPDIDKIRTEIKATTAEDFERLAVAGFTLNFNSKSEIDKIEENLWIAYRMALKMQNLLLIKTEKTLPYSAADAPKKSFLKKAREAILMSGVREKALWSRDVRFTQISLHMFLLFKKLWDILEREANAALKANEKIFSLSKGKLVVDNKTGKITVKYDLQINVKKVQNVEGFIELYAYHSDLLKEIKANDGTRKSFWAQIGEMRGDGSIGAKFSDIEKSMQEFDLMWRGDLFY